MPVVKTPKLEAPGQPKQNSRCWYRLSPSPLASSNCGLRYPDDPPTGQGSGRVAGGKRTRDVGSGRVMVRASAPATAEALWRRLPARQRRSRSQAASRGQAQHRGAMRAKIQGVSSARSRRARKRLGWSGPRDPSLDPTFGLDLEAERTVKKWASPPAPDSASLLPVLIEIEMFYFNDTRTARITETGSD